MQILSEAMPMTNGEVYALLRRRRDERNAARHPPFGLQPFLAESHIAQQQAAPQRAAPASASSAISGAASAASGFSGVGDASSNSRHFSGRAIHADALDTAAAAAAASTASLLAAPSSGHIVVLLTEVTVLNYLANHASFSHGASSGSTDGTGTTATNAAERTTATDTHTLRDVYGPTSIYDRGLAEALRASGVNAALAASSSPLDFASMSVVTSAADALTDAARVSACYAALAAHRPGTVGHVRAAAELLEQYEEAGRGQERVYAAGIRRVVQLLWRQRLWTPQGAAGMGEESDGGGGAAACVSSRKPTKSNGTHSENGRDDEQQQMDVAAAADANARASVPLLLEPTPLWHPGSAGSAAGKPRAAAGAPVAPPAPSYAPPPQRRAHPSLLSEADVLQLVVGRPERPLDVYRLLDDVDRRLQYSEVATAAFVEGVISVFSKRDATAARWVEAHRQS
ncbi:hypothetical protein ABL78_6754 [Leptomonas seymouri]|uniref:Uncharacterized protein n=1 Tax=Leptomonas seymouri TaxID=5684 RepID=A0A0N0P3J3_LEPSE|nr:hypothetical protein ABL78_6754 [Leptomonas seymouri]|eukprot:KPI84196.1 hypothetical protein ABL78_6754 [Leptomonas seymouri]